MHPNQHRVSIEHPSPRSIAAVTNFAFVRENVVVDDGPGAARAPRRAVGNAVWVRRRPRRGRGAKPGIVPAPPTSPLLLRFVAHASRKRAAGHPFLHARAQARSPSPSRHARRLTRGRKDVGCPWRGPRAAQRRCVDGGRYGAHAVYSGGGWRLCPPRRYPLRVPCGPPPAPPPAAAPPQRQRQSLVPLTFGSVLPLPEPPGMSGLAHRRRESWQLPSAGPTGGTKGRTKRRRGVGAQEPTLRRHGEACL